jgi:hypothetical protein
VLEFTPTNFITQENSMTYHIDQLQPGMSASIKEVNVAKNRVILDTVCTVAGKVVIEGECADDAAGAPRPDRHGLISESAAIKTPADAGVFALLRSGRKRLVGAQEAPLPERQVAEQHRPMRTRLRPTTRKPTSSHMRRIWRFLPSRRMKRSWSSFSHSTFRPA